MKIYLVVHGIRYEGESIIDIYSDLKKAIKFCKNYVKGYYNEDQIVEITTNFETIDRIKFALKVYDHSFTVEERKVK